MNFTVYKSSAGSGKTFNLVKEYLKIVLQSPEEFRNILAVTFTNKAANEMKERIINYLKELSAASDNTESETFKFLLPELIEQTNLDQDTISQRANIVLELILHNYSDFAISTIDSFVHKIIKTFAHDLHLPLNFDVELDTDNLISQAIDLLLSCAGNDEKLTKILVNFTESKTENEQQWNIEYDLKKFAFSLLKEDSQSYIDKLKKLSLDDFFSINEKINIITKNFENTIIDLSTRAYNLIKNKNINNTAFFHTTSGAGKYFENLSLKHFDKLIPNSSVTKTIEENKWYSSKANTFEKEAIDSIKNKLFDIYYKIQDELAEHYDKYIILKLLNRNIYSIALLNEIEKTINEIKSRNNIVHISEFNKRIAEIVLNEPIPFIYERLGEKYKHFLIDEFQDTSILQWQNFLPLIDNSLAEGNFNMVVGDGKQAIYRWRNGEVEQFAQLPKVYKKNNNPINDQREQSLIRNYKENNLNKNFRSKAEIVDFNNKFFKELYEIIPSSLKSIYENLEQEFDPKNTGGLVNIDFLDKKDDALSYEDLNYQKINEIINELQNDKFDLKDIAILCRSNKDASNVARYLIKQNIDVISSESILLSRSPEINFLFSCIQVLNDTSSIIAKAEMINFLVSTKKIPAVGFHETLQQINNYAPKNSFNNCLKSTNAFIDFLHKNGFDFSVSKLTKLPIYDLCEELIRIFELDKTVNPYIEFFLDAVLEYSIKRNSNISDFIEWWDEKKDKTSIIAHEGINAVNIMTIHKSKGLEFPVVIFPFADQKFNITNNSLWVDLDIKEIPKLKAALIPTKKELEYTCYKESYLEEKNKSLLDLINLLYVVMTRASDRLYILTSLPPKKIQEINSPSKFFYHYLKNTAQWKDGKTNYTFGIPKTFAKSKTKTKQNNYKLKTFISNDWRNKILINIKAPEVWDIDKTEKNQKWGNIIHTALSKIKNYDDVDKTLDSMYFSGIIDDKERKELYEKINQLLSYPDIKPYFEKNLNIKTEAEILLPNGKTYRPDRVILNKQKAVIIDYKTGKTEKFHIKQINNYANLLSEMGYTEIKKYLLYIDEKVKIVEV